ncbi:DUF1292 domain-containing protein [Paenibacillus glycanilyticus]|uniref:DUF1292 domain-containing protein n=1 Tax=Paenibacillus glycanilyticus TaxID=126569 RepID=UPI00203F2DFE|nr:DUF1292 domain-containing protein [Paenibacillus glycanilyticus]MCM3630164.1 DUF1292 domain-containing protein [Paenibacillus glycanilyticus]
MANDERIIPVPQERLREVFGNVIELVSEHGSLDKFEIMAEFQLGPYVYAALQSPDMKKEQEVELFRVILTDIGEPQLETIEDDDEWELAAEAYDDLLFANDEMP